MNTSWSEETMRIINGLTPDIKGKAFDPGWFQLRQRLEEVDKPKTNIQRVVEAMRNNASIELPTYGLVVGPKVFSGIPTHLDYAGHGEVWYVKLMGVKAIVPCFFDDTTAIK
jgi:hypothetical protein